jgi:hypothetical protein
MATSWPWTGIYGSVRTRSVLTYRDVETGGAAVPSIERRVRGGELRWYARFRDPAGAKKVKVFNRRVDAERFLTTVEASKLTGSYIDPKRAAITFGAFAQEHRAAYSHTLAADPTRVRKRSVLDRHILPTMGIAQSARSSRAPSLPRSARGRGLWHREWSAKSSAKCVKSPTRHSPTAWSRTSP